MNSLLDKETLKVTEERKGDKQQPLERVRNGRSKEREMRWKRHTAPGRVGTW